MRSTCTLCGSASCRLLFSRSAHATIRVARPFSYHACLRCGAHFLDADDLPEDPYLEEKNATITGTNGSGPYVHWDDDIVRSIQRMVPGGRLLDLGSGWGHMLEAAARAGFEAEGVDVSPALAREARARSGRPVFEGDLRAARYPSGWFDVVNAHFVLEYVPDPMAMVAEIARVLAPHGVLRICGYTTDSLPARVRGARWWNYSPTRRHLFSRRTISFLAASNGLAIVREVHGGERSIASYAEDTPRSPARRALGARGRWWIEHARLGPLSLTSRRAFYLARAADPRAH